MMKGDNVREGRKWKEERMEEIMQAADQYWAPQPASRQGAFYEYLFYDFLLLTLIFTLFFHEENKKYCLK